MLCRLKHASLWLSVHLENGGLDMETNVQHKMKRIKKLAGQIRDEQSAGHAVNCPCPICQAAFMIQRTVVWLEGALEEKAKDKGQTNGNDGFPEVKTDGELPAQV